MDAAVRIEKRSWMQDVPEGGRRLCVVLIYSAMAAFLIGFSISIQNVLPDPEWNAYPKHCFASAHGVSTRRPVKFREMVKPPG